MSNNADVTINIDDVGYRIVPLGPHLVEEFRSHARREEVRDVATWTPHRRRSIVQLSLRRMCENTLPFCGPAGGRALEIAAGEGRLIEIAQEIAEAEGIFPID